jgi:hypothetical protein
VALPGVSNGRVAPEVGRSKANYQRYAGRSTVRKLYLVPIIHMSADMGSLASALDERATAELGRELWQRHKQVVSGFWDSIARFFDSLDISGSKVYQDGLITDGLDGLIIIREGIAQGSKNYEIIAKLMERGAVLVRTEDLALVRQEHTYITKIARSKSLKEKEVAGLRYKLVKGKLLMQRDDFIAQRVNETLREAARARQWASAYASLHECAFRQINSGENKGSKKLFLFSG